jgi:hypothetical protein
MKPDKYKLCVKVVAFNELNKQLCSSKKMFSIVDFLKEKL